MQHLWVPECLEDKDGVHSPESAVFHKQNIPFSMCGGGDSEKGVEQMQDEPSEWEFLLPPPHSPATFIAAKKSGQNRAAAAE